LPPILAAYRKHQPDDPWLAFYEGYFAVDQADYQKADQRFLAAEQLASQEQQTTQNNSSSKDDEEKADESNLEYLLSLICRERCQARYELGDDVELLSHYPRREEAYRALAEKAVAYRHWAVLDRINQAFRKDEPSNPWLAEYSVRLAIANREFQIARDQLQEMATREGESPLLKYLRRQLQQELVWAENPDPLRRFELSEDRTSAFRQISNTLLDERDWANLETLCLQHPDGPDSADVAMIRLEQAWSQDGAKVVQLLTPWPDKLFSKERYQGPVWRDRLVRSLLRLQKYDQATAISQDAKQRFGEVWPLFLTCVANRDSEKIEQLLSADDSAVDSAVEQWKFRNSSDDQELQPLLYDSTFASFRNRYAFDLTVYEYRPTLTILLNKPCKITEEWLSTRLAEPQTPQSPLQISQVSADRFVVCWNQTRFLLTSVAEPYFAVDTLTDPAVTKHLPDLAPETRTLFEKQQSYWQIVRLGDTYGERWNVSDHQCREFAAKLLNDDAVGVAYRSWASSIVTVVPLDSTQAGKLSGRQPLSELDRNAVILHNRRVQPRKLDDEKRQTLRTIAARTPADDATKRIVATVQLAGGDDPWLEKFQLLELRLQRYGELEIIGEYYGQDYSNSLPELRSGIRYVIPLEQVIDINQP
jgi:hypothetical protein